MKVSPSSIIPRPLLMDAQLFPNHLSSHRERVLKVHYHLVSRILNWEDSKGHYKHNTMTPISVSLIINYTLFNNSGRILTIQVPSSALGPGIYGVKPSSVGLGLLRPWVILTSGERGPGRKAEPQASSSLFKNMLCYKMDICNTRSFLNFLEKTRLILYFSIVTAIYFC